MPWMLKLDVHNGYFIGAAKNTKTKTKLYPCLEGWVCAHAGMGALGSASLLPVTRQPYSCDDAGPLYLCIFSLCEGPPLCGGVLSFWVLVQVDLGSLAACSRLGSVGVGEGTDNYEGRVIELQRFFQYSKWALKPYNGLAHRGFVGKVVEYHLACHVCKDLHPVIL